MKELRSWALALLIVLAPAMSSCWRFRRSKPVTPSAPASTQSAPVQLPPPPGSEPAQAPAPEQPAPSSPRSEESVKPPPDTGVIKLPAPQTPRKRPSPAGPRVEQPQASASPEPVAEPPTAPAPELKEILTPERQQQMNRVVSERIQRARQVLASLAGRKLDSAQHDAVNQITTFIGQAEEARKTDLVRAKNLAERAEVLARDLMSSVR